MAETAPPGADQGLKDMAASWQPLIDSVNQRRQPAPATPESRGNLLGRIFGRHRGERQPAREPEPALTPERQRNPFAGVFQGAISGARDNLGRLAGGLIGLKDRLPSVSPEAGQQLADRFTQKASATLVFGRPVLEFIAGTGKSLWESKTELAAGALAGSAAKEVAKTAASFFLPGGILVRAGAGALGGMATAAAKETVSGVRGYNKFKADLDARLKNALSLEAANQAPKVRAEFLRREYLSLQSKIVTETNTRQRESLVDNLRYLGYFIKKQDWQSANRAATPQEALNEFLAYSQDNLDPTSLSILKQEILRSERVDKTRLRRRVLRGAVFGAAGAIAGGLLVDFIHGHFEAAGSAMPTEATPAVPRPPAPVPDAQAAAPPPAPAAPAAPAEVITAGSSPASVSTESLPPTTAPTGAEVSGSVAENSLTYGGKPWVLMDNGVKNIGNLFKTVGETGDIDKQVLASNLENATKLWTNGQLNYTDHPDLYRIFHLSNGTGSVYNNLLDDNTLESLKKLGIVRK